MLDTAMDIHLGRNKLPALLDPPDQAPASPEAPRNRRNGYSQKTVQGELGEVRRDIPRDRNGSFEPQLVGKYQRRRSGFDDKILAWYAKGLTPRDLQDVVQDLYGVEGSPTRIAAITADLDGAVSWWRSRRLDAVGPIVYFAGIVVPVRGAGGVVSQHTLYVALGVNLQGRKELLGLWLAQNEGAKFWLACLTDLKNRGLSDILVAGVDGRTGFPEAIRAAYPQTKVQRCVVHLVRAALTYVSDQDSREVVKDLQAIDQAATVSEAEQAWDRFAQKWDSN
jgi:transposase-like protein